MLNVEMAQKKWTPSEMGKKGAASRAAKLTPEQRKKIARKAAKARWGKET
jgi:hypothetical protein